MNVDNYDFTDSYDINGKPIYEGDKVKVNDDSAWKSKSNPENIGIVTWGKGSYYIKGTYCTYDVNAWSHSIEVLESLRPYRFPLSSADVTEMIQKLIDIREDKYNKTTLKFEEFNPIKISNYITDQLNKLIN